MTAGGDASTRQEVRVISVYATRWRRRWKGVDTRGQHLDLGRLEEFYSLFEEQLPRDLLRVKYDVPTVTFTAPKTGPGSGANMEELEVTRAELWLFALPSDQVVAALDLDFESPPLAVDASRAIKVLEHGAYGQIEIGGKGLEETIAELAREAKAEEIDTNTMLPPERHQIVFAAGIEGDTKKVEETIALILYRSDPPYRPQFMEVRRPSGLNSENGIGAVTPYVSLLSGHPEYIENSVFLTVVQAVGTSARFRQIWHQAHGRRTGFPVQGSRGRGWNTTKSGDGVPGRRARQPRTGPEFQC